MDIAYLIKNVNSLNEYIAATQDSSQQCKTSKIQLNMSTVLALKKIKSYEIEYVNKCEENGIACTIFERMLCLPPSKIWAVLSKEMVNLLQYWLDAVRKHLVKHSPHWWSFLKLLLRFIKTIRQKDTSVPNILVEYTSEGLLDLATIERPNAMQRYEILHCFNMYCSESSREIRFALRNQFGPYFTKLANYMSDCGNLATQYSIMETLLRWLLPRQDRTLRITSATKWFPARLYTDNTVDIFLERPWVNFFQDARDFLNSHNIRSDLITSVVCKKVSVGDIVIISDGEKMDSWLDVNYPSKCISVLLDPRVLEVFGCTNHKSFETFVVSEDNTLTAKLCRESDQITLSMHTITPPSVLPSCIKLGDDVSCYVTIVLTSHCDMKRFDTALRRIFDDKYQLLLDLEKEVIVSPKVPEQMKTNKPEAEPRFSHPVEAKRRVCHSGYMIRSRAPLSSKSPSTASTSSLAQLHDKLAALPKYTFDKEPQTVCALPDLSVVSEASEFDERSTKTLNYEIYENCNKNLTTDCNKKSQSDNETSRRYPDAFKKGKFRQLSPIVKDKTPSCLLLATIGSADESVINDTVEKLSNREDFNPDNIVDLLVQEALQANIEKDKKKEKEKKHTSDGDINVRDGTKSLDVIDNSEAIVDISNTVINLNNTAKRCSKVVSPTSDESNTEDIEDTPKDYVNISCRSKKRQSKVDPVERESFDIQAVEKFFSQHFNANRESEKAINSSLAKKNNETISDISEGHLENNFIAADDLRDIEPSDFNNIEILDCLNSIVDKVCDDFDKYTKYLIGAKNTAAVDDTSDIEDNLPLKDILNKIHNINSKSKTTTQKQSTDKIKLKYKVTSKQNKSKSLVGKRNNKLEIETVPKMSTIIEDNAETPAPTHNIPIEAEKKGDKQKESAPDNNYQCTTPQMRRKRKLFSPKDEQITEEIRVEVHSYVEDNTNTNNSTTKINKTPTKINKTPKSTITYKPYQEIEKERAKHIRMSRNRKSRKADSPSPRSKKMNDLFDKVKESANGEHVTLAKKEADLEVYNFSTDSEDDFKEKKIEITKKASTTTLESIESTTLKRGRVVKRVNYSSKNEKKNTKRNANRRQRGKKETIIEPTNDLIDERMREQKDVLNTSMVVETSKVVVAVPPELILEKPPEMEAIDISEEKPIEIQHKMRQTRKNKGKAVNTVKKVKKTSNTKLNLDADRTESPLPGLVVEKTPTANKEDVGLSVKMVNKFKNICKNPEKYINDSNTTQNLLSDTERNICSPQNVEIINFTQVEIETETKPNVKLTRNKKANSVKSKRNSIKKNVVKGINLRESEAKYDKSIDTDGITGHGDSEEAPPSPKLISEILEHRNLHTEYFDITTKDFFDKLTEEINAISHNSSNNNNVSCIVNKAKTENVNIVSNKRCSDSPKSVKSAVVSIKRMSSEDISRWLPSRRNSDTDEYSQSSKKTKQNSNEDLREESPKNFRKRAISGDEPAIQEANRSLRSRKNKSPIFKINTNSKKSQNKSNDSDGSVKSAKVSVKSKKTAPRARVQPPRQAKCTPASIISPIQLFEDLVSNAGKMSQTTLSDDEEYMNDLKQTVANIRKCRQQSQSSVEVESLKEVLNNKNKINSRNRAEPKSFVKSPSSQSSDSKVTRKIDVRTLKRTLSEDSDSRKKKKIEDNNNIGDVISGSSLPVSSIVDWLRRSDPDSRTEEMNTSLRDSIQCVIEKLDTTLLEIHQNTSNKFVQLFVSAQQQLSDLKQERRDMYKRVASDMLSGMLKLFDEKFAELDNRSQEQDTYFMNRLKEQASAVIREDCKKKRVMVTLLKEDVQAVLQHMRRSS